MHAYFVHFFVYVIPCPSYIILHDFGGEKNIRDLEIYDLFVRTFGYRL